MVCITLESAVPLNGSGSFISTPRRARVPSPLVYYMPAAQFLDLPESRFRASRAVCVLLVPPRRNHRAYSVLSYSSYKSW